MHKAKESFESLCEATFPRLQFNDVLCNELNLNIDKMSFVTPFNLEFYREFHGSLDIVKEKDFSFKNSAILFIQDSGTYYEGAYLGMPVIVKEIMKEFSTIRQTLSLR